MKYSAVGTHNRHFELIDERNIAHGKLGYTSWFSINAEMMMNNGDSYEIDKNNIWHTSVHIVKNGIEVGKMKFNWSGQIVIELEDGKTYIFKHGSLLRRRFVLVNSDEREIIMLQPRFNWTELSFNYEIETDENYPESKDPAFVLLLVYCSNFIQHTGVA